MSPLLVLFDVLLEAGPGGKALVAAVAGHQAVGVRAVHVSTQLLGGGAPLGAEHTPEPEQRVRAAVTCPGRAPSVGGGVVTDTGRPPVTAPTTAETRSSARLPFQAGRLALLRDLNGSFDLFQVGQPRYETPVQGVWR